MPRNAGIIQKLKVIYPNRQIMKRTHYIYKLPLPGNVTFRICCGSWRGGVGSGGGTACILYDGGTLRRGFAKLPRIRFEFSPTNTCITAVAQQLQLDVVIHLALEFAIRRHLTVEILGSAHLHPRVPRVPQQPNTSPIA